MPFFLSKPCFIFAFFAQGCASLLHSCSAPPFPPSVWKRTNMVEIRESNILFISFALAAPNLVTNLDRGRKNRGGVKKSRGV
ncbi:hypothetical protein BX661DRAFT_184787 [Kickxella alabastrina]|uniref:uncharacterized protein n=1 Tax=Kickxella alabastrina TaxID=61397 RepID=UPI00221E4D29|nr:uncharacterized protein BX661DRAFT_184787 [Kickxella alabastrina]KAI7825536.1 hypothetical protein BX661DRAFT_184787 [Kickxella alabastrina]